MSKKQGRDTSGFGKQLRLLRKKRKITMKNLAQQLHVSESYISRLESSERHPDKELILKLEPILFPEGSAGELDRLLIAADYTPVNLDQKTGQDDVVLHFQRLIENDPTNFRAYNALVILLIKHGNLKAAQDRIEIGLKQFKNTVQLKVLMSALKLAQQDVLQAIELQKEALAEYETTAVKDMTLKASDLLYNLGDMYFAQGYALVGRYLQKKSKKTYQQAHQSLALATEALEKALLQDPDNVLILDEYAKVLFNTAYLEESAGTASSYTQAIEALQRVIQSENKQLLNYSNLMESTLSLVHAYAKIGNYGVAEQQIHIIECCLPNFWLAHYIKACVYSLKYQKTSQEQDYLLGMKSLKRACLAKDRNNRTVQEAPYDPDLEPLRLSDPSAFKSLLQPIIAEAQS